MGFSFSHGRRGLGAPKVGGQGRAKIDVLKVPSVSACLKDLQKPWCLRKVFAESGLGNCLWKVPSESAIEDCLRREPSVVIERGNTPGCSVRGTIALPVQSCVLAPLFTRGVAPWRTECTPRNLRVLGIGGLTNFLGKPSFREIIRGGHRF